jgi:hypothetical protein
MELSLHNTIFLSCSWALMFMFTLIITVLNFLALSGIFGVLSLAFQRAQLSRVLWWFGKQNHMGQ